MAFGTRLRLAALAAALTLPAALTACTTDDGPAPAGRGDCPTDPVAVVVSLDQWGDIVARLGGSCATVTTLLAGSAADPHDFEPPPADAVRMSGAQLVVLNGGNYDEWAAKLAATSAPGAPVISAVAQDGNPHVWYDPTAVTRVADAVTARLAELAPGAADYFAERHGVFAQQLNPYTAAIAKIKAGAPGRSYAATEPVFDPMAEQLGLVDRTPAGYRAAAARDSDPAPADLSAFLRLLSDRGVDLLIFNTQTQGALPAQLRDAARAAGVPVVEVTETIPPGTGSFLDWQLGQLRAVGEVLGVAV